MNRLILRCSIGFLNVVPRYRLVSENGTSSDLENLALTWLPRTPISFSEPEQSSPEPAWADLNQLSEESLVTCYLG
jgi:hypothetical protein